MNEAKRKRGRPREFDPAEALASASEAFLRYGYAGTSLDTLSKAMNLNKPSLYAAFGDKHALYMSVLEARYRMVVARARTAFERGHTLEESLRNVFENAVEICLGEGGSPGCPIAAAATTESLVDDDVGEFTKRFRRQTDRGLANWISRKRSRENENSSETLGRMTNCILNDIAVRARLGESRAELFELARDSARVIARAAGDTS